jgi:hypothetical protein
VPKYYIKSGEIKYIVDTTDETSAILSALYHYKKKSVMTGPKICVSEKGFESFKDWNCYDIDYYLKKV